MMLEFSAKNIKMWSRLGSCGAYGAAAMQVAEEDEKAVFVTADLRFYSGLERFYAKYPDRFYNVGIAEQNMVGIAAGLASEGFAVFASTYGTFASARCADQVRVNMGYMKLPVKIVGLTSGLSVGILGPTHMGFEDIAFFRAIPNMVVLSPADCTETVKAILAAAKTNDPTYIRLTGTMGNPIVYNNDYEYEIGKAITLREGKDIVIVATGTMVYNSLKTAEILSENGIEATVLDIHTIKPLDVNAIKQALNGKKLLVTVEEHSVIGGLGGAVAQALCDEKWPVQLTIGLKDDYPHAADYNCLLEHAGLTSIQIANQIQNKLSEV